MYGWLRVQPVPVPARRRRRTSRRDPAEDVLPDMGLMTLRDPETGQVALINTRSRTLREKWQREREEQRKYLKDLLRKAGVDLVDISTAGSAVEPLSRLFDKRRKRL